MSFSGTNWPPKRPKRPRSDGAPMTGALGATAMARQPVPSGRPPASRCRTERRIWRRSPTPSGVVGPVEGAGGVGDVADGFGPLGGGHEVSQLDGVLGTGRALD